MLYRIYCLVLKELLAIWRDPKSRFIIIGPPLIQLLIFSFAATLEVKNIDLAILNQDSGKHAHEIVQRFKGSPYINQVLLVDNMRTVEHLIDDQKVMAAVIFDARFSRQITLDQTADVQIILDGRNTNTTQIVNSYLNEIIQVYNQEILSQRTQNPPSTRLIIRHWFNPNLNFIWFIVPSLFVTLLTIAGIIITGLSIAREREMGTFDQLLVSPITPFEILIGKTIPALLICSVQAILLFLISIYLFKVPFVGSLLLLIMSTLVYLMTVIGIGLFISALSMTQQQAILGAFVFVVPAILISGFATPVENMPVWLQDLTVINPIKYFLIIVKGLYLKGLPAENIWSSLYPLMMIAVATMSFAIILFKKRVG